MRVVFLGSPAFAVPSLQALANHPDIRLPLVVTQPDRPAGRGRSLTPPPIKVAADALGVPTLQPATLRDDAAVTQVADARPDVLVVVAYGELLHRDVLDLAPHGCLNVHPSLLPKHRGATPIPAAILAGDARTGVSIIRLVRKLDAGPVVTQLAVDIKSGDTTGSLNDRLAQVAAELLPDTVIEYVSGNLVPVPQDDALATHTREWTTDDTRIDWSQPAAVLERLVRAANPWPMAWTIIDGTRLRILEARVAVDATVNLAPGCATTQRGTVVVQAGAGVLELVRVQAAGKRPVAAADWWRGVRRAELSFGA